MSICSMAKRRSPAQMPRTTSISGTDGSTYNCEPRFDVSSSAISSRTCRSWRSHARTRLSRLAGARRALHTP
nr:unnamed protein product [Digitaria exilis]